MACNAREPPRIHPPSPKIPKFKVALCQVSLTPVNERNIAHASALLVVLPGRICHCCSCLPLVAVDNQLFVVTCSPARDPNAEYVTWAHSTVVGPFGEIMATTGHEEATVIAEIDYSSIQHRRVNLPLEMQRCGNVYQLVDVHERNAK